jgi:hypothetical protein
MKDSVSGAFDSITRRNAEEYFQGDDDKWERKEFTFYDRQNSTTVATWTLTLGAIKGSSYSQIWYVHQKAKVYFDPFISWPMISEAYSNYDEEIFYRFEIIPSLSIAAMSFNNVYHVQCFLPRSNGQFHWYINKEVGLLKIIHKIDTINRNLEIVRWK